MKIRYYISSHGYGHGTRSAHIVSTLRRLAPTLEIDLVSALPPLFLRQQLDASLRQRRRTLDCGVLQSDGLRALAFDDTLAACRRLLGGQARLVAGESRRLIRDRVSLVATDIPWIPCLAAKEAKIPAVGISNFSWDLIYRGLAEESAGFDEIAAAVADGYRDARLLRLPFGPSTTPFADSEAMPLVARRSRLDRRQARQRLGVTLAERVALLCFGGFGLDGDWGGLARLGDWTFVSDAATPTPPANLRQVRRDEWYFPDLLRAADVVVTKPGYGIVSEAIVNDCAVLYARRHFFREEDYLVAGLHRYARALEITETQLRRGDWQEGLLRVLALPRPTATIDAAGAEAVATRLLALAGGEG